MEKLYPAATEKQLLRNRIKELESGLGSDAALVEAYDSALHVPEDRLLVSVAQARRNTLFRRAVMEDGPVNATPGLEALVAQLPPTSPGRAYAGHTFRIGIIADLFLYKSFEGLADFIPITPENFADHRDHLDLLLVVSTWRGVDNKSWIGLGGNSEVKSTLLEQIIPQYREAGIPIAFYSKEDPPNYKRFVSIAAHCDHIFTSAVEMIPRYRKACPNAKSVQVLPFGVNPIHHSPIGSRNVPSKAAFFAGSWFTGKYSARAKWGSKVLDGIASSREYDLTIFDRNSAINNGKYDFPLRYAPYLNDAVGHDFLLGLQRVSDVAANLNSVMASQSMYANRAIELQASGTLVVSTYNQGLNSHFPHVFVANSARDVKDMLDTLTFEELRSIQAAGIRNAFGSELALYRIDTILEASGLTQPRLPLKVGAVTSAASPELDRQFAAQSYGRVPLIGAEQADRIADLDVVLRVDPTYSYGSDYALDMVNAFKYADTDIVQKLPGTLAAEDHRSHRFAEAVTDAAGIALWRPGNMESGSGNQQDPGAIPEGASIYNADAIGFSVRGRESVKVLDEHRQQYELSVIVPVYNNGGHLRYKCFTSLRRSSMFRSMEIILVDDGSTDPATIAAVDDLAARYSNVRIFRFEAGGSGSASRPRNKGLELATAPFITYLDPDNEAVEDGYSYLWNLLQGNDADFAIGNMSIWREGHRVANYATFLRKYLRSDGEFHYPVRSSLTDLQFRSMSIQAAVARTSWLKPLGLVQPLGAVGQDSFFFQQMLFYAKKIRVSSRTIHTYYSAVENSTVNSVSARFFEKYLPLEEARSEWVREIGLDSEYRATRLEPFFRDWFLTKFALVSEEDRPRALATLARLGSLYGEHEWTDPKVQEFWLEHEAGRTIDTEA